jgi:MYXO-CTERM domain-containing protein
MSRSRTGRPDPNEPGGSAAPPTRPRRRAALPWTAAAALAVLVASSAASTVAAASPAASASAEPDFGAYPNIEVWFDQAVPADARAGSKVEIGFTIWDSHQAQFFAISGLILQLEPKSGKAAPTEAETRSDWPGHLVATVVIPKGGPGTPVVIVRDHGDRPLRTGGTGPPVSAPLSSLVGAEVHLPSGNAIAGQPLDLVVDVRPLLQWDPPVGLPDRLVVIASLGRGPDIANSEIRRAAGSTTTFAGPITVPQAGDVELVFAFPGGTAGPDDIIQAATTRILVRASAAAPAAASDASSPTGDGPPWPLIGGGAALAMAAAWVIRRVFADL